MWAGVLGFKDEEGFENFHDEKFEEVQFIRENEYAAGDIIPKKLAPLFPLKLRMRIAFASVRGICWMTNEGNLMKRGCLCREERGCVF